MGVPCSVRPEMALTSRRASAAAGAKGKAARGADLLGVFAQQRKSAATAGKKSEDGSKRRPAPRGLQQLLKG